MKYCPKCQKAELVLDPFLGIYTCKCGYQGTLVIEKD